MFSSLIHFSALPRKTKSSSETASEGRGSLLGAGSARPVLCSAFIRYSLLLLPPQVTQGCGSLKPCIIHILRLHICLRTTCSVTVIVLPEKNATYALRGVSYDELERPNDSLHVQPYQRSLRTPCSLEKAQRSPQHPPYLRGSHHRRKRRSFTLIAEGEKQVGGGGGGR